MTQFEAMESSGILRLSLTRLIKSCLQQRPSSRPTVNEILNQLATIKNLRNQSPANYQPIVDNDIEIQEAHN